MAKRRGRPIGLGRGRRGRRWEKLLKVLFQVLQKGYKSDLFSINVYIYHQNLFSKLFLFLGKGSNGGRELGPAEVSRPSRGLLFKGSSESLQREQTEVISAHNEQRGGANEVVNIPLQLAAAYKLKQAL